MLKPLFNKCKIEVIDDYAGITRAEGGETLQKGRLKDLKIDEVHLTASTGFDIGPDAQKFGMELEQMIGKVVYWEQYADSGAIIEEDGKRYAFVPFYRLIAVEED